ncbi:hypothetical protein GCM10027037_20430 [Mucilaginibacter koreensis]
MEQEQTAKRNQTLQELLSKPGNAGYEEQNLLKQLVKEHPQSGLLQALYACIADRAALKQAGVYFNSAALYKTAHSPSALAALNEGQLVISSPLATASPAALDPSPEFDKADVPAEDAAESISVSDTSLAEIQPGAVPAGDLEELNSAESTRIEPSLEQEVQDSEASTGTGLSESPKVDDLPDAVDGQSEAGEDDHINHTEHQPIDDASETEESFSDESLSGESESENLQVAASEPVVTHEPPVQPVIAAEDDEIYEEIVGIEDINFTPINQPLAAVAASEHLAEMADEVTAEENAPEQQPATPPVAVLAEQEAEPQQVTEEMAELEQVAEPDSATLVDNEEQPEEGFTGAQETEEDNENTSLPVTEAPAEEPSVIEEVVQQQDEEIVAEAPETTEAIEEPSISADADDEVEDEAEYQAALADQQDEIQPAEEAQQSDNAIVEGEQFATEPEPPATHPAGDELIAEDSPAEVATPKTTDVTEKLIIENIAATDYFIFDQAFRDRNPATAKEQSAPVQEAVPQPAAASTPPIADENSDVSKYHDEKMPYSFMWWLDKTRREHAGIYQPYIKPQSAPVQPQGTTTEPDANLQHQYIESILHQTPVDGFEADHTQTVNPAIRDKEHKIIERFIQEEPQIKPPSSEKLGSENKAKRSAEDQDELITETLARIYADQMLYAKAIATYKKLILKFPEKSTYFADQIARLQQKIS